MRILHINCNYMGTGLHQVMMEHLEKHTIKHSVFCPIYSGSKIVTKPHDNVTVSKCYSFFDRFLFFRKQKKLLGAIRNSLNISEFSCLHAYTLFTDGNAAYNISKEYNIPYVVAIRATDLLFFKYRPYLRSRGIKILKRASAIFFLSDKTKKKVYGKYINKQDAIRLNKKTYIVPNGIDDFWLDNKFEKKKRVLKKDAQIKIVCVSKVIKRKNIPTLQKAIQILNNKGWKIKLSLIGEATDKQELKKILSDKNTAYIQPVSKEKLIEYYREADMFVLPSKGETFGLVYAEAMSQGLPVIYSADEGFDGQFEDGVVGYSVKADSEEDIVHAIKKIISNYSTIQSNTVEAAAKFDWTKICQKYSTIYKSIKVKRI